MTCDTAGIIGQVVARAVPTIVQGSDSWLVVQTFTYGTRQSSAIESFGGATGYFRQADGGFLTVNGTLESAAYGRIRFDLAASGTALLQTGDSQTFQYDFLDDGELQKLLVSDSLNVAAPMVS